MDTLIHQTHCDVVCVHTLNGRKREHRLTNASVDEAAAGQKPLRGFFSHLTDILSLLLLLFSFFSTAASLMCLYKCLYHDIQLKVLLLTVS